MRNRMYMEGEGSLWRVGTADFNELGVGMTLYFRLVKYLAVLFAVLTLVAVPAMFVNVMGQRSGNAAFDVHRLALAEAGPRVRRSVVAECAIRLTCVL